jgi:4-hydroxybenzoate polyprenyltransferase
MTFESSPKGVTNTWSDGLRAHLEICRFDHWIKNVFALPGFVVATAIAPSSVGSYGPALLLGLLALGLVASSNYVLNELLDAPSDLNHPIKRARPVPSGRVLVPVAYVQWLFLAGLGFAISCTLPMGFRWAMVALWLMGGIYNVKPIRTKDVPYLDVLSESVNNPLRMLAGWYVIDPPNYHPSLTLLISYWMIGCYFMALKRFAELRDIGDPAVAALYRRSFSYYSSDRLLQSVMFYASAAMIFLGAFAMRYRIELTLSFPFVAWVMAIYMHLAFKSDSAVQAPEKLYREPLLMISVCLCAGVMLALLFIDLPWLAADFAPTLPVRLEPLLKR